METGKPGLENAPVHINSVAAQTEKRMDVQAPLTALYIHTVPALPGQPYAKPPTAAQEPATLHLAMPPLYSKETLPFLTLHIAGGLQSLPGLSLASAVAPLARPKSSGKHVCPHCGRDCMKPSVLEKHLRCHTGERPYPCDTCGVSFKTQSNLYKHKRTQAHARLWSESEQSSLGSQDSMSGSGETCTSSLSLDELGSMEREETLTTAGITAKVNSVKTQGSVSKQNELIIAGQTDLNERAKVTIEKERQRLENEKPPLSASRHLPLQRQEATLFSKQWETSVSRAKSQSHESTDSGFSESSDHYPSPGSVLPDHSMDSLAESTKERLEEETTSRQTPSGPGQVGLEPKDTAREQEQKTLEERISKLISENTLVVEDKKLENVRPRKTVLSKQGSIDLPMPYTYKDSFHFDMRISKAPDVGLQRYRKPGFYNYSVPTQNSTTMEHAPLTRSSSLPFSVSLLQPERSSPTSSQYSDYETLVRTGSSGQINPRGFAINQHSSTHRPLVRQTAVDCNHATDALSRNSSVEEACTVSLSCDGEGGGICGEPSNRKFRRKKTPKFAYNKWYMYGGGTFKKLYNNEKGGDDNVVKGRKCSMNQEHQLVQGLHKRLSAVQKETVTTTCSTTTFTSGSACHPECPAAKLVSAADLNLNASQLHASCISLKTPLRSNLSLSTQPFSLTGSLVSHKSDISMSRPEGGSLSNEEKHTDSSSQLCEAHIPSNRKKQKTDEKIMCPLEMETDPNILFPPPTCSPLHQKDTNLSYINLKENVKHDLLKGSLFPLCIINANTPPISTSPATFSPTSAKARFLPKYQLKLPNAAVPDSKTSNHVVDKSMGTDVRSFTSALSSSHTEQTSLTTPVKKCSDPLATSPLTQSCYIKKTNVYGSTQGQLLLPRIDTTCCQADTSRLNKKETCSVAVMHRQFATTTITTTCLQEYQSGLCSASIQPSESAFGSVPIQLPRPVIPTLVNFPATSTLATVNNQTSADTITHFSKGQPNPIPPLSQTQLSLAADQLNRACAGSNMPTDTCPVVPFDQMQPAAQNVFHVHTADLQICFQIISDEQLALIEPQIERQVGEAFSHRRDMEKVDPEVIQNNAQSSVSVGSANEGRDQPRHQEHVDRSESLPTLDADQIKPPLFAQFGKEEPNLHRTEHSNSTQALVSAECKPPATQGSAQLPHKYSNVNMVTETQSSAGDVMSTAASLKCVKSGMRQTSDALSLNRCAAEELLLPDRRVGQGGLVSQTLSGQNKPHVTSPSPSTVGQNSMISGIPSKESQSKRKYQGALCNVGTMEAKGEAPQCQSRVKSGETTHPLKVGHSCAGLSSFSINECKPQGQLNHHTSIDIHSTLEESPLTEAVDSPRHANMGCDMVGPTEHSAFSQDMSLRSGSQDVFSSAHSEKQLAQFTSLSSNIQVDRAKDIPAVLTTTLTLVEGPMEGVSIAGCAAQNELQILGHGESFGQPQSWRPKQSQEAEETSHQCRGQGDGGDDEEPGQWDRTQSNCIYTCLKDMTKPEGEEDRKVKADSIKNSCGAQTSFFNSPQPLMETSNFYCSKQDSESCHITNNQETEGLCASNSGQHIKTHQALLAVPQFASSQIERSPQQTFTLQDQKPDQKQTSIIAVSVQQENATAEGCCTTLTSGSLKGLSSSTHPGQQSFCVQVSGATVELTLDTQASNNNVLDANAALPSNPFTYPARDDYQDDTAPNDYTGQSGFSGRHDITNTQSYLFADPFHGCQTAEGPSSGVRAVQSCHDYTEDTSSSDDEGKLIIEL